jgi:hypothetical protein
MIAVLQCCSAERKRFLKTPHDELNGKVFEFLRCCRGKNISVLQEKAREMHLDLKLKISLREMVG